MPPRPGVTGEAVRRAYSWVVAPLAAACLVAWASSVNLERGPAVVRALAVGVLFAGSCVLVVTPGVALVSVVMRRRALGPATGFGLLCAGAGASAMTGFWAWFASVPLGQAFDALLLSASVAAIGVCGRQGDLRRLDLSLPLSLALIIGLLYTGIAFLQGGIAAAPTLAIEHEYWLTVDNQIPLLFAGRVAAHLSLHGYLVGNWLSSDRPPLQTAFVLLQWPLWLRNQDTPYQLLSTCLQTSWLPALWVLLRVRGVSAARACAVVLPTAATGVVFFNTVYVWPKMLAGALVLTALAILVSQDDRDRWAGAGVLAVVLATLSMLAHGGSAFAIIALIPFGYVLRRRFTMRAAAVGVGAVLALYLPWTLFQRLVDPPGDRLIKWQLAGVLIIDKRGVLQTLVQQYGHLSAYRLLANKLDNVVALVANPGLWHTQNAEPAWTSGFLGYARIAQLNEVLPAAGPLLLGALALLIPSARRRLELAKPLAAFTVLSLVVWVVLLWGNPDAGCTTGCNVVAIVAEGPYAPIVLFIALCAVAVIALPRPFAIAIVAADIAWFTVSWVPGLGFRPASPSLPVAAPFDPAMFFLCIGVLVALGAVCFRHVVRPYLDSPETAVVVGIDEKSQL